MKITSNEGQIFDTTADLIIGTTTVAAAQIVGASKTVGSSCSITNGGRETNEQNCIADPSYWQTLI